MKKETRVLLAKLFCAGGENHCDYSDYYSQYVYRFLPSPQSTQTQGEGGPTWLIPEAGL